MSRFAPVKMRERMIRETEEDLNRSLKQPAPDYWCADFAACGAVRECVRRRSLGQHNQPP